MTDADNKEGESIMKFDFLTQAAKFLQERKAYRRWLAVFMCLALAVTFGTVAALKMYGQAMTHQVKVLECQYKVHEHTEDCYEKNEDGEPTGEPVCGYADYVVHTHNDDCYDENKNLVCPLEEIEKHEHDDGCYEEEEILVCGEDEAESTDGGHEHTDACYTEVKGELICEASGEDGHTHDESCYSKTLTCDREEHTHDDGCYEKELVCDNEDEDHAHDDGCYEETFACDKEEHEHGDDCYSEELTCGQEESSGHEHTDDCYEMKKELTCEKEEGEDESKDADGHTHDEDCYQIEKTLTCGELELHTHTEALTEDGGCYDESAFDEDGEFIEGSRPVCGIPQLEEHVHTAECFKVVELTGEEVAQLNAGGKLHVHDENCYDADGNLICEIPAVHVHGLECYDEDGNLICGSGWAHTHDESCYDADGNLICEYQEEEEAHEHDAYCYNAKGNLVCGYEGAKDHEHDADCYDKDGNLSCSYRGVKDHEHDAKCYDEERNLVCGYEGAKDHAHSEDCYDANGNLICGYEIVKEHEHDANCYDADGNLICGYEGARNHEHDLNCYDEEGNLICGYEGVSDHMHTEACYNEDGNLICGYKMEEIYDNTRTYEGEGYIVTVKYNDDAEIPEKAQLIAEEITSESDEEHYTRRDAEFKETLDGANVAMKALLKVGFYLDGGEIEPKSPVSITVQFLDENGLPEGKPVTVVHFAEDGTEKLNGSDVENGSTTFKMKSFSEIAIGYETEDITLPISENYEYESDNFYTVFHIEGEVTLPMDKIKAENLETEDGSDETDGKAALNEAEMTEEADVAVIEETSEELDDMVIEEEAGISDENEEETDDETSSEDSESDHDLLVQQLEFSVKPLDSDSEEYAAFDAYTEGDKEEENLSVLQVLSYALSYEGQELDLSECTVTAMITPTSTLLDAASEYIQTYTTEDGEKVENGLAINVYEQAETGEITGLDGLHITEDMIEETEGSLTSDIASYLAQNNTQDWGSEDLENGVTSDENIDSGGYTENTDQAETPIIEENILPITMKVCLAGTIFAVNGTSYRANPGFTVQYYAYLERTIKSKMANDKLSVINTEGGNLPKNGNLNPPLFSLELEKSDGGKVKTNRELTRVYTDQECFYADQPNLRFFDKLQGKDHYALSEIWVLKENADENSINPDDWEHYAKDIRFTNRPQTVIDYSGYVLIEKGTVIRLVYEVAPGTYDNSVTFYDYDISTGTHNVTDGVTTMDTKLAGINSSANYDSSTTATQRYAFGNANAGVDYQDNSWSGQTLNKANAGTFKGCTFGLAKRAKGSEVVFNCPAPKSLFGTKANGMAGKNVYAGDSYELQFNRLGDTYTLSSALKNGSKVSSATNLDSFNHPVDRKGNAYTIWTNNFWPMDDIATAKKRKDIMFGSYSAFGNGSNPTQRFSRDKNGNYTTGIGGANKYLPLSDDGKDHNSYFGMYYTLTFDLSKGYIGPLEYLFFGDDDMWVFLDDTTLICDIGGVHSTVGEYVDLWDYLGVRDENGTVIGVKEGEAREHTLKFFYTERGASGSSCWMQFTLPDVDSKMTQGQGQVYSNLKVGKTLAGADIPSGLEYEFRINFNNTEGPLRDNYSYAKYNSDNKLVDDFYDVLISDGETFRLGNGEYILLHYLPEGTTYTITETGRAFRKGEDNPIEGEKDKYDVIVDTGDGKNEGSVTGGTVVDKGDITINYINDYGYELPETGGPGTEVYAAAGALLILLGAGFVYKKKFRERRV